MTAQTFFQWSDLVRVEPIEPAADEANGDADYYTSRALELALEFAARGWRVLPCYGIHQGNCTCKHRNQCERGAGKHPHFCVHKGLKGADNRAAEIIRWFEKRTNLNVGVRTGEQWDGASLLVIDIDNKIDPVTGKRACELLAELEAELGPLPRTHVIETGSGGLHVYLSYPKGLRIKSTQGKLGYGIDMKGEDSYVVAPPSRHKSGGTYKTIQFDAGPPPMIPQAWLNRFRELGMVSNKSGLPTNREAAERAKLVAERAAGHAADPALDTPDYDAICDLPPMLEGTAFDPKNRRVMGAIGRAMLTGSGQTNAALVSMLCSLKNIPAHLGRRAEDFRGIIRWWYEKNKDHMSMREWDRVWDRFVKGYDKWARREIGPHWRARDAVRETGAVETAMRAKNPAKTLLVSIYHALQDIMGTNADIWLSCDSGSDIMRSLGFDLDRNQVNRLQRQLRREGVILIQGTAIRGGWFAQRVRTAAAVLNERLVKAQKAVLFLMTPRELLTLAGSTNQNRPICALRGRVEGEHTLIEVALQPTELAHASQFMPPDRFLATG